MPKAFLKYFLLLLIASVTVQSRAQSPNWAWARSAGGTSDDFGYSVSTDVNGNVLVTGTFGSSSLTFGTTVLTNAGGSDIFIVKYDAGGNLLWAKSAGGTSTDYGYSVSSDANGNVFVTGSFTSPTLTFGTTVLTNPGTYDIFIVKYDGSGNVLWAKSVGGTSNDYSFSVSSDANGNVFATGYFNSPSLAFGTTILTTMGGWDIFVAKLNGVTGISELSYYNNISLFPNPSTGIFNIEMENGQLSIENYQLSIYNVLGEQVFSSPITNNTSTPNKDQLPMTNRIMSSSTDFMSSP